MRTALTVLAVLAVAATAIGLFAAFTTFAAYAPQQVQQHGNTDPWERLSISPKHYRVTTLEGQATAVREQAFVGTIPLPPNLGSVFVVTDVTINNSLGNSPTPGRWTVHQAGGPRFAVSRQAGHATFTHGIVFDTNNTSPIILTVTPHVSGHLNNARLGITLAGYTM